MDSNTTTMIGLRNKQISCVGLYVSEDPHRDMVCFSKYNPLVRDFTCFGRIYYNPSPASVERLAYVCNKLVDTGKGHVHLHAFGWLYGRNEE